MNDLKIFWILCLYVLFVSCQTFNSGPPVNLPGRTLANFGDCWKTDGSVNFALFKDHDPVVSASVDWVQDPNGRWRWEVYDLLGRVVLAGELFNGKMRAVGQMASDFAKVGVDSDGFLSFDNDALALKWKEFNCFLSFRMPEEWMDLAQSVSTNSQDADFAYFIDNERTIDVKFDKEKVCGILHSRFMLFFRRERVGWCFFKQPKRGYLVFENVFRIEWVNAEEKEREWTTVEEEEHEWTEFSR